MNKGVGSGLKPDPFSLATKKVHRITAAGSKLVVPDPAKFPMTRAVLTANCAVRLPRPVIGQRIDLALSQGGAGGYTATWETIVRWARNIAPTLSTQVGDTDYVTLVCTTAGVWDGSPVSGVDRGQLMPFSLGDGSLTTGIYQQRFRSFAGSIEILGVSATTGFGYGPSGADIILDLVTSDVGTTLWGTNPANRPTILAGNQETLAETVPDTTIITSGISIRAKCVQTGVAPNQGSYVNMFMRFRWAS
jgi:hypothetical protein